MGLFTARNNSYGINGRVIYTYDHGGHNNEEIIVLIGS